MADKDYHKNYWTNYKKHKRQVTLTLTQAEYNDWQSRAKSHGRTFPGQQILAEAKAYRNSEKLIAGDDQARLAELSRIWRGIGTNLNQLSHHSNRFKSLVKEKELLALLQELERQLHHDLKRSGD